VKKDRLRANEELRQRQRRLKLESMKSAFEPMVLPEVIHFGQNGDNETRVNQRRSTTTTGRLMTNVIDLTTDAHVNRFKHKSPITFVMDDDDYREEMLSQSTLHTVTRVDHYDLDSRVIDTDDVYDFAMDVR
jgi:hypothetical protein